VCLFYGESTSRSIPQVASLFSSSAFWLDWRSWKCGSDQYTFASNRWFWWGQKISQMINGGLNWEKFQNCCLNGKMENCSRKPLDIDYFSVRFVWANPCVWALSVFFVFSVLARTKNYRVRSWCWDGWDVFFYPCASYKVYYYVYIHTYIWVLFGVHLSIVNGAVSCLKLLQCAST
jgi:hypothetical protein